MKSPAIEVECYSGGRADERPRRVVIDGREYLIARLLGTTIEERSDSRERVQRFRVLTDSGSIIELVRESDSSWRLVSICG